MNRWLVTALVLAASPASADRRLFTYTFEYRTVPQGQTSIELWHTESRDTWDPDTAQRMQHALEIEHGLTDHWDAGIYTVFGQVASNSPGVPPRAYAFEELKLETRYRFADRGEWPVDLLAYCEIVKAFGEGVYAIEGRAVLARDFDSLTAAVNLVGAIDFEPKPALEFGYAAGLSYELHPKFSLGAETYATITEDEKSFAGGPALAVAPSSNLWLTLTLGVGLNDVAPALAGRFILGIEL